MELRSSCSFLLSLGRCLVLTGPRPDDGARTGSKVTVPQPAAAVARINALDGPEAEELTSFDVMETSETRRLIESYYEALRSGDRDRVSSLVADDCRWVPPAGAPFEPIDGGPAVVEALTGGVIRQMFDLSQPFALEVRSMMADGDTAVVQQRLTATAKETGQPYDNQYCWVYTCRDGRIAHMEEYADTLVAARTMGWV